MAGRKPKPTALKIVTGNPGKRPLPENEPKPKQADLSVPDGLSVEASKHWQVVARQLHDARILTELDTHALCLYCEAYSKWMEANNNIAKYGMVVKSPNGFPVQSPYLSISNKAFEQMKGIMVEFGMTPSSRTRVQAAELEEPVSEWID